MGAPIQQMMCQTYTVFIFYYLNPIKTAVTAGKDPYPQTVHLNIFRLVETGNLFFFPLDI